ncbi:MAG: signal peptidase I [Anaerolineae bacterium]|nr:signal peptidase I [Anaerolineae bacterium]
MTLSADTIATISTLGSFFSLALYIFFAAGLWKTLAKAGEPGWAAIIPVLNWYFMVKISGRPGWWMILFLVPILNIVIWLMVALDTAYAFGKTTLTGILLFFLPWVMYPVLGFSDATYQRPKQTN